MKKFVLTLTILIAMTLVVVATAFAAPPDREIIDFDDTYPIDDCGIVGVGDFLIYNHEVGTVRISNFFDKDGNWIKEKGHVQGTDHLFAEGYPDKVIEGKFVLNWTQYEDPETGLIFSHEPGNWWHLNLPGHGNVIHLAGLEDYLIDFSDPDEPVWNLIKEAGLRTIDRVAVCEYLAPPP